MWIFIDDLLFLWVFDQFFQVFWWISQFVFVIDEGEIVVVVGNKGVIILVVWYVDCVGGYVVFGKQFILCCGFQQVVIKVKYNVGFVVFVFYVQVIQQ